MENLGPLGDLMITLCILSLLIQLLRCFFGCIPMKIYAFLDKLLFFSSFIQASNQGFLFFFFVTFLSFSNFSDKTPNVDKGMTYFMIVYLVLYTVLTFAFLIWAHKKIENNSNIRDRFGSLFELVRVNRGLPPILNVTVFFLRRLFLAYILIYWKDSALSQIFGLMSTSFIILVYQSHYRPFYNKVDRFFEFYNEYSLLAVSYCLLATVITDHVYEETGQRFPVLDVSLLVIIVLVIALNFINYLVSSFRILGNILRRILLRLEILWKNLNNPPKCQCINSCHQHHQIHNTVAIAPSLNEQSTNQSMLMRSIHDSIIQHGGRPQIIWINPEQKSQDNLEEVFKIIKRPVQETPFRQDYLETEHLPPQIIVMSSLDSQLQLRSNEISQEPSHSHKNDNTKEKNKSLLLDEEETAEDGIINKNRSKTIKDTDKVVEDKGKVKAGTKAMKSLIEDGKEKLGLIRDILKKKAQGEQSTMLK